MSKDIYLKLAEELGRDPTDEEVADATADMIDSALDSAHEVVIFALSRHTEEKREQ